MVNKNTDFYSFEEFTTIEPYDEIIVGEKFDNSAFLTIIITTYNRPKLVFDAIKSALNQVTKESYNVLVVDNCSDTEWWKEKEPLFIENNIKIVRNRSNLGMFGNMNQGVILSVTPYVSFLHDDDYYSAQFVSSVYDLLINKPDIKALHVGTTCINSTIRVKEKETILLSCWNDYAMIFNGPGAPTGFIIKRDLFLKYGGYNPAYYPTSDYCFACLFAYHESYYKLNRSLCYYRVEDNASLKVETLTLFIHNDYYLQRYIFNRYSVPYFLVMKILGYLVKDQERFLKEKYNHHFNYQNFDEFDIKKNVGKLEYLFCRIISSIISKKMINQIAGN